MKDWWGKQAAIATSLGVLALIVCLAMGAGWVRDVSEARQTVYAAPEASCGLQEECAEKDLPAQIRAARAGEALVDLAVWQLIVSVVALLGIVGLFWNIVQGHAGLERSREANEIALDATRKQLRAYPVITAAHILDDERDQMAIDFRREILSFDITNHGNSPVPNSQLELRITIEWGVFPFSEYLMTLYLGPLHIGENKGVRADLMMEGVGVGYPPLCRERVYVDARLVHNDIFESSLTRQTRQTFRQERGKPGLRPAWSRINHVGAVGEFTPD